MTDLERTRHDEMLANINKMVADVDLGSKNHTLDQKKYMLEIIRLVMYGVIAGSALTLAIIKIVG